MLQNDRKLCPRVGSSSYLPLLSLRRSPIYQWWHWTVQLPECVVEPVRQHSGLSSSRALSPIELICSRESLGHGPIRVVQEYQSPIGPRASREETGRSIKVSLSE